MKMSQHRYFAEDYVAEGYTLDVIEASQYVASGYVNAGYFVRTQFLEDVELAVTSSVTADLTEKTATEANAAISSSFSASCNTGLLLTATSSVSSTASVSSTVSKTVSITSNVRSTASVSSTVAKTVSASADFGALFSPSMTVGTIKVITATLVSNVSLNATVSKIASNQAVLSNIINLSLQGAKTVGFISSTLPTTFAQTSTVNKTAPTGATLSTAFTTTATPGTYLRVVATLSSNFSLSANRWILSTRPVTWERINSTSSFSTSEKKYGSGSLQLWNAGARARSSDIHPSPPSTVSMLSGSTEAYGWIPADTDFAFEVWIKFETDHLVTNDTRYIKYGWVSSATGSEGYDPLFTTSDSSSIFQIGENGGKPQAIYYETDNSTHRTLYGGVSSTGYSSGWNHVGLKRVSGTVYLTLNNATIDSQSYSDRIGFPSTTNHYNNLELLNYDQLSSGDIFYDSLHFQIGKGTYTGYSSDPAGSGTIHTVVLEGFNGSFADDLAVTLEGAATLTSSSTLTANAVYAADAISLVASAGTLTATVGFLESASATVNVVATVSGTGLRTRNPGALTQSTASTVGVSAVKQTDTSSSANLAFTTQIDGGAVKMTGSTFDAVATNISIVVKIADFFVNVDNTFTQTATVHIVAGASATLPATFTQSTSETLFKSYNATLSTASTVVATVNKIVSPSSSQSVAFTQTANGDRIRFGASTPGVVASILATPNGLIDYSAALSSAVTVSTTVSRFRSFASAITSNATLTSSPIISVSAGASVSSSFSVTADNGRLRDGPCDFDSILSTIFVVAKIGDFLIDADVISSISISAVKTTDINIDCPTTSTVTALVGVIKQGASTQASTFTQVAQGHTNITATADVGVVVSVTSTANYIAGHSATLSGAGGFVISAVATRNYEITASSAFALTTDGERIRTVTSTVSSVVSTSINAGKLVEIESQINTISSFTILAKVIDVNAIVYIIPAESREYSIISENKEFTVASEDREHTINGDG